ncbi:MAG TPA: saccharopine dehydrogenase NADP-binding domain-containing protein [Kofleriaceae bacterium]|nr:saccharopine dehydrogenase NADP-binding domain-containing protein [Kofleriaceae bacterium]
MTDREFDIVVFGATGFTGRLTAEYLAAHAPPRWAIAGRSRDKLAALGLAAPILVADALDRAACADIARRARVVCTTVGPYTKYGSELVAACAAAGTHYCDLTGEVSWMRAMIDAHHARAVATGARIVHTCGFDSIPSDLGTWATQQEFAARFGRPAATVTALFGELSGTMSGGTAASAFVLADAMSDPAVRRILRNPHALDPDPDAPHARAERPSIGWERHLRMFTMPFFMADTNGPVVRRAHALAGFPWGKDFVYREIMSTPGSARGLAMAVVGTGALAGLAAAMKRPRLREWLKTRAPKPGEGPSPERRARGHWTVRFVAEAGADVLVYIVSDPHGDPGYASTSKMLAESALCLALDPLTSQGGVQTPSVAMGRHLFDRLRAAGLTFASA